MMVNIQDVHYGSYDIKRIYYGSNLVFNKFDDNQNVYVFDLTKVVGNYTLNLQNVNSGTSTNWGDGNSDTLSTHTYASQGTYTVKTRQRVNNYTNQVIGDDNARKSLIKCINIDNTVSDYTCLFYHCINLITPPTVNNAIICRLVFQGCTSLATAPIIPNSVTDCYYMFNGCTGLTTIPQANIDLMQSVKVGANTTLINYSRCYNNCTNIVTPQTYTTLNGLYPNWFTS